MSKFKANFYFGKKYQIVEATRELIKHHRYRVESFVRSLIGVMRQVVHRPGNMVRVTRRHCSESEVDVSPSGVVCTWTD